jgi:hypothetical protein
MQAGNTPVHLAAGNGLEAVIDFFLDAETQQQLNYPACAGTVYNQQAAMRVNVKHENTQCRLVDLVNDEPNTPLIFIGIVPDCVNEQSIVQVARSLVLEGGSNLWHRGRAGNTVLCESVQHGQLRMTRTILETARYAFLQQVAKQYPSQTPLEWAAAAKRLLADYINHYNDYCENAVILAARSSPAILELLL